MKTVCEQCKQEFDAVNRRGVTPKFCSNACRQKAYRRRRKNVLSSVLTDRVQWVRAAGKRPIQVDGSPASSANPATWSGYKDVMKSTAGDGYGIMLGCGLGCYDLDHCLNDGVLESWAKDVLEAIEEPVIFTEVSVSGHGLHVFVEAEEGRGTRTKIERYTWARFIRVTGNKFIWR